MTDVHTPAAPKSAQDLALSLMQLHMLYSKRHDLLPSDHLVRINAVAGKLATFLDGLGSRADFFEALRKLEAAVDALSMPTQKECFGTGTRDCMLAGRDACLGPMDCLAAKVKDPEVVALLEMSRDRPRKG